MTAPLDFSKPVRSRDGHPVTILLTEVKGLGDGRSVVGILEGRALSWTAEGLYAPHGDTSKHDLIQAPPEPTVVRQSSNVVVTDTLSNESFYVGLMPIFDFLNFKIYEDGENTFTTSISRNVLLTFCREVLRLAGEKS